MTSRLAPTSRHAFRHEGRVVYEWEQTIEEVCLFVQVPAGVRARDLGVSIAAREVSVGIRGNPPYLQHALHAPCVTADSTWTLDGGELAITLAKSRQGEAWPGVFEGHRGVDAAQEEEEKKRMMLERFQAEHPGFDFSGAEFNGAVPDAHKFMDGFERQ